MRTSSDRASGLIRKLGPAVLPAGKQPRGGTGAGQTQSKLWGLTNENGEAYPFGVYGDGRGCVIRARRR
jgi:hypothetical protein